MHRDFLLQPDEKPTAEAIALRKKASADFKAQQYTPWRLMSIILVTPIVLLIGTVGFMNWMYSEKFAQTPCQGICEINETVLSGAPFVPFLPSTLNPQPSTLNPKP